MLSILCPHCGATLTVEERCRGTTIHCLCCDQQLAVASVNHADSAAGTDPTVVIAPQSSSAPRRGKPAIGNRIISTALHLSITAATVYAGYYLLSQRRPSTPRQVELQTPEKLITSKPKSSRSLPRRVEKEIPSPIVEVEKPVPLEVVAPPVSPFKDAPLKVSLPSSGDGAIVTLMEGLTDIDFQLVSNSSALTHADRKIFWQDANKDNSIAIAGLAWIDNGLKFRWIAPVPPAAEAAIRNSIVRLSSEEFQHVLILRNAGSAEPLQIDLNKDQQKILSKCDYLPAVEDIRFELIGIEELPTNTIEGADPARLQARDQTTLQYSSVEKAATRLTVNKRGNVVVVELESRYALPSGEEQPMSIRRGNSKLKEIESLYQEALAAEKALQGLKSQLKNLAGQAKAVPTSRATAAAKSVRLAQLRYEITTARHKLAYAERLLSKKSAIEADRKAIQQVAELAQQLHETKLAYRFFTIVDGHKVDILVAQ